MSQSETTITGNNSNSNSNNNNNKKQTPEYNPRWKGYVYLALSSLVNFASISNVAPQIDYGRSASTVVSMTFGVLTFILSALILMQDRSK